jgi:hypothetical protein
MGFETVTACKEVSCLTANVACEVMWQYLIHNTEMLMDIIQLSEGCISYGALCAGIATIFRWLFAAGNTRFYVNSYTDLSHWVQGFVLSEKLLVA